MIKVSKELIDEMLDGFLNHAPSPMRNEPMIRDTVIIGYTAGVIALAKTFEQFAIEIKEGREKPFSPEELALVSASFRAGAAKVAADRLIESCREAGVQFDPSTVN